MGRGIAVLSQGHAPIGDEPPMACHDGVIWQHDVFLVPVNPYKAATCGVLWCMENGWHNNLITKPKMEKNFIQINKPGRDLMSIKHIAWVFILMTIFFMSCINTTNTSIEEPEPPIEEPEPPIEEPEPPIEEPEPPIEEPEPPIEEPEPPIEEPEPPIEEPEPPIEEPEPPIEEPEPPIEEPEPPIEEPEPPIEEPESPEEPLYPPIPGRPENSPCGTYSHNHGNDPDKGPASNNHNHTLYVNSDNLCTSPTDGIDEDLDHPH